MIASSGNGNGQGTPTKECRECCEILPLISFDRDDQEVDGYRNVCKTCRIDEAKAPVDSDPRVLAVQEKGLTQFLKVSEQLAKLPADETGGVRNAAELYEEALHQIGGPAGFSQVLWSEFYRSKPGSQIRIKCLQLVAKLAMDATKQGLAEVPLDQLSDADLERETDRRFRRMMQDGRMLTVQPGGDGNGSSD